MNETILLGLLCAVMLVVTVVVIYALHTGFNDIQELCIKMNNLLCDFEEEITALNQLIQEDTEDMPETSSSGGCY